MKNIMFADPGTKQVLGTVTVPDEFQPAGQIIPNLSTSCYPIEISCSVFNTDATVMTYFTGEGYTDRSKSPMLSGPFSGEVNRISRIAFKNFMSVEQYVDEYALTYAKNAGASLQYIGDREMPIYGQYNAEAALDNYKAFCKFNLERSGEAALTKVYDYYQKPLCRVYRMKNDKIDNIFVVATVVEGMKYGMAGLSLNGGLDFSGITNSLANLVSPETSKKLFGNSILGKAISNRQQAGNTPVVKEEKKKEFGDLGLNQMIDWRSNGVFMLQCWPAHYEEAFNGAFKDFCSTFKVDQGITRKSMQIQDDLRRQVQNYTQQNIQMQQQQFAASQRANATLQSAYDSYNQAWWDRSNSHHASVMSSSTSSYSSADKFSEAIRGVNTYVREDGSEVEVDVKYDRAYTNNLNDTLGSNSYFEPGGNWTEMERKK